MRFLITIILLLLTANQSSADIVRLKSGKVIEGKILEKTMDYIKIDTGEKVVKISFRHLDERMLKVLEKTFAKGLTEKEAKKDGTYKSHYPGGKVKESATYEDGKVLEMIFFSEDGKILAKVFYVYDSGRLIHLETYDHNWDLIVTEIYKTEEGQLLYKRRFDSDDNVLSSEDYLYDDRILITKRYFNRLGDLVKSVPKNGEKPDENKLKFEGEKTVERKFFDDDNNLIKFVVHNYKDGNYVKSTIEQYDSAGEVIKKVVRSFEYGELRSKHYDKDGILIHDLGDKKVNKKYGSYREYYENGRVKEEKSFNKALLKYYKKYSSEGVLLFKEGSDRIVTRYDDKGKKLEGVFKEFYDNKQLKTEKRYSAGKLDGNYVYYSENGIIREESNYKDGVLWGERKLFDKRGNLISKCDIKSEKDVGKNYCEYFSPDGWKKKDWLYNFRTKEGIYNFYSKDGKIKRTQRFDKGKLVVD